MCNLLLYVEKLYAVYIWCQQDWQEIVSLYEKDNVYLGKQSSFNYLSHFLKLRKHSDVIVCMCVFIPSWSGQYFDSQCKLWRSCFEEAGV